MPTFYIQTNTHLTWRPTEPTLFAESIVAGVCAHERKLFLSWAQGFHLTRKKVCSHDKKHRRRVLVVKSGRVVYRFLKHKALEISEKGSEMNARKTTKRNGRIGYNRNIYAAGQKNKEWSMSKISHKKIAASQQEAERYNWSRSMLQWDLRRNNCASLLQYLHTKIRIL